MCKLIIRHARDNPRESIILINDPRPPATWNGISRLDELVPEFGLGLLAQRHTCRELFLV